MDRARAVHQIRLVRGSTLRIQRGTLRASVSRREFCASALGTAAAAVLGCKASASGAQAGAPAGRLRARPAPPTGSITPGLTPVEVGPGAVGSLYVPASYVVSTPLPLVLALHGAGGTAVGPMNLLRPYADSDAFAVLSVKSRNSTWDVLYGGYGPDVLVIDEALEWCFRRCNIDPARVFVEGFSDGASYALGIGITNGDLFRGILAFSPGFVPRATPQGRPGIFISHGTVDEILPIADTSRRIVPELRAQKYDVVYREFVGPHRVPPDIARAGIDWMLAAR